MIGDQRTAASPHSWRRRFAIAGAVVVGALAFVQGGHGAPAADADARFVHPDRFAAEGPWPPDPRRHGLRLRRQATPTALTHRAE